MTMRYTLMSIITTAALIGGAPALAQDGFNLVLSDGQGAVQADYSLADLDAMEQITFTTTTIWTEGRVTFSGVPLALVLEDAGLTGETLKMTALNEYAVEMPMSEVASDSPVIATRMNGEIMSVRERGPFWLVYNYDADPAFQTETVYARSIWQLNRLNVVD